MTERYSFVESQTLVAPTPLDLPAFVPYACARLQASFTVRVHVLIQDEYVSKIGDEKTKKGKQHHQVSRALQMPNQSESASFGIASYEDGDEPIELIAVRDSVDHVVELKILRASCLPRLLFKVIALCLPYQPQLYRLTVRWTPLPADALHEISRLLPAANITELCLDDSPAPHRNFEILLEEVTLLRSLSLARCDIDDAACTAIALRLSHPRPASRSLAMLSLSSNHISDAGAAALATSLRGNRALQYLNLAGNRITDEGAAVLMRVLTEFALTAEEIIESRRRSFEYVKAREELTRQCLEELRVAQLTDRGANDSGRFSSGRRKTTSTGRSRKSVVALSAATVLSSEDMLQLRATAAAVERLGPRADPFSAEETVSHDSIPHCVGNTTLCALNLAYNSLSYSSLVVLLSVLRAQAALGARLGPGLLHVVLEGNALPQNCNELTAVQQLLDRALAWKMARPVRQKSERIAKPKSK